MSVKHYRATQTGRPSDKELVNNIAQAIIRKHNVVADQVDNNWGWEGDVERLCPKKAMSLDGQTLGRVIMAFPQADLYGVHCSDAWLGQYESGPLLLRKIAATAILWRIRVILGVREEIDDHHMDWLMRDF